MKRLRKKIYGIPLVSDAVKREIKILDLSFALSFPLVILLLGTLVFGVQTIDNIFFQWLKPIVVSVGLETAGVMLLAYFLVRTLYIRDLVIAERIQKKDEL